ncbi:hypothetical protein I79_003198 [Cricetulus griseus]|uniref:Uncharacterized protein n=1 Tax=Cricetulus griseus TaxID=10029 RepID=G3GZD5_CRIGR|nr:hypothetical protein I79_003198 [Cricetulus griseus]
MGKGEILEEDFRLLPSKWDFSQLWEAKQGLELLDSRKETQGRKKRVSKRTESGLGIDVKQTVYLYVGVCFCVFKGR